MIVITACRSDRVWARWPRCGLSPPFWATSFEVKKKPRLDLSRFSSPPCMKEGKILLPSCRLYRLRACQDGSQLVVLSLTKLSICPSRPDRRLKRVEIEDPSSPCLGLGAFSSQRNSIIMNMARDSPHCWWTVPVCCDEVHLHTVFSQTGQIPLYHRAPRFLTSRQRALSSKTPS